MDEFSFIDSITPHSNHQSSLIKGIGDDAAVIQATNQNLVTSVDTFVEDIHFSLETMKPYHVGYRALAANLSDLAAMGATPAFYLVSIVIPSRWNFDQLKDIFGGMNELASQYQMDIIGGDTVSGKELTISITVIGYTMNGKERYRSNARIGDYVFVTGTLGDSQAGFHLLTTDGSYTDADYYIQRHRMPSPRVQFSSNLRNLSRIALNDISDGVASEANEIAESSHVTIELEDKLIPTSISFQQFSDELQHKWKYYGGEDFELIGTVSPNEWESLQQIAKQFELPVTKIGKVTSDNQTRVFLNINNEKRLLHKKGYNHLR
ncbi:thiamine-phosphate kinase [Oceanobacillus senegalensis]|uniref:thiamine-phosphate kinase n=1 Tax=Oceanobacillus senegalensis TaxID=1936063 RepID=UPI000A313049|nr:thiamine-phosphate kinase [Oceanobacillus senegalensis]